MLLFFCDPLIQIPRNHKTQQNQIFYITQNIFSVLETHFSL